MPSFASATKLNHTGHRHRTRVFGGLLALVLLVAWTACDRGTPEMAGWRATEPSTDLALEPGAGPDGEDVTALLYTMATGQLYVVERSGPPPMVNDHPALLLKARATRTLYLAVVLIDENGRQYECCRNLRPGDWHALRFDEFSGFAVGTRIVQTKLVDRTAQLGSQGPVSLKLVGLTQ